MNNNSNSHDGVYQNTHAAADNIENNDLSKFKLNLQSSTWVPDLDLSHFKETDEYTNDNQFDEYEIPFDRDQFIGLLQGVRPEPSPGNHDLGNVDRDHPTTDLDIWTNIDSRDYNGFQGRSNEFGDVNLSNDQLARGQKGFESDPHLNYERSIGKGLTTPIIDLHQSTQLFDHVFCALPGHIDNDTASLIQTPPEQLEDAFPYVLPADVGQIYADGNSAIVHIREPFRLFPGSDTRIPTEELDFLTDSNGLIVRSELTNQALYDIKFLPPRLDAYEDIKADRLEKYYAWGADRQRDILPRMVNAKMYYTSVNGVKQYDTAVTIQNAKNALSMTLQRSRRHSKGGLLPKYVAGRGTFMEYLTTKHTDLNGNVVRNLIPMENILFGIRVELMVDINRMVFTDLNGRDHPLFTPQEVPHKVAQALLTVLELITPTLADLFTKWPHIRGYKDTLHPLMPRRIQEEHQMRVDLENEAVIKMQKKYRPKVDNNQHFRIKRKTKINSNYSNDRIAPIIPLPLTANKISHVNQDQLTLQTQILGYHQAVQHPYYNHFVSEYPNHGHMPQTQQPKATQMSCDGGYIQKFPQRWVGQQFSSHLLEQPYKQKTDQQYAQELLLQQPLHPEQQQSPCTHDPVPNYSQGLQVPLRMEEVAPSIHLSLLDPALMKPKSPEGIYINNPNTITGELEEREVYAEPDQNIYSTTDPQVPVSARTEAAQPSRSNNRSKQNSAGIAGNARFSSHSKIDSNEYMDSNYTY